MTKREAKREARNLVWFLIQQALDGSGLPDYSPADGIRVVAALRSIQAEMDDRGATGATPETNR